MARPHLMRALRLSGQIKDKTIDVCALRSEGAVQDWTISEVIDVLHEEYIQTLILGPFESSCDEIVEELVESGVGSNLLRLELQGQGGGLSRSGAVALTRGAWCEKLQTLWLEGHRQLGADVEAIVGGTFPALEVLSLRSCDIGAEGAKVLAGSPLVARIEPLALISNQLGDAGVEHLASSDHVSELVELGLSSNGIGPRGVRALVDGRLAALEHLRLDDNPLGADGLSILTELVQLKSLNIERCRVKTEAVQAAFDQEAWPKLERFQHEGPLDADLRKKIIARDVDLLLALDPEAALMDAVHNKRPRSVTKSLKDGADPNCAATPLREAVIKGNEEVVTLLLDAGADPNVRGLMGEPLVFLAAKLGQGAVLELLADRGADLTVPNDHGVPPVDVARRSAQKVFADRGIVSHTDSQDGDGPWIPELEERVLHKKYGEGVVKEIRTTGEKTFVSVLFAGDKKPRKMLLSFVSPVEP